jgi:DNA polymerase-3 subunit epsilon
MTNDQTAYAVIDIEATSADATLAEPIEIAAVFVTAGVCHGVFSMLTRPGQVVPTAVTTLTGITNAMLINAPPTADALVTFASLIGDSMLAGYNLSYDRTVLDINSERCGLPFMINDGVDTMSWVQSVTDGHLRDYKLSTIAAALRLPHRPKHRALPDALATADLLDWLITRSNAAGRRLWPSVPSAPYSLRRKRHMPTRSDNFVATHTLSPRTIIVPPLRAD